MTGGTRHLPVWLSTLAALPAAGCDFIDEWYYEGTQIGLERCVSRVANKIVSEGQAYEFCAKRHERPISDIAYEARGNPCPVRDACGFGGDTQSMPTAYGASDARRG